MVEEVRLAKAFAYSSNSYGAESYINGFSGYALELIIVYYKKFSAFITAMSKLENNNEKIIIDIQKNYRNRNEILLNLNASKLQSPVILIDPTFPSRNALAALSNETFKKFQEHCRNFIRKPSPEFFKTKSIDFYKKKDNSKKNKLEYVEMEITTDRQEGDIAGSKLIKFFKHLSCEIKPYFEIKESGFEYGNKNTARVFFSVKRKKEILFDGPSIFMKDRVKNFKKVH